MSDSNVDSPDEQAESNPSKKPKATSFADAFSNLKKSEFYKEPADVDVNKPSTSGTSRAVRPSGSKSSNPILVSPRQRGNPLLKSICNVPWEFSDEIVPDYVMGRTTCALFLSLRYHNLNPDYINERLKQLGQMYELRVLLVQVDFEDPHHSLRYLTRISILTNVTLMLAWNAEEAGRIIETYKVFENKPPDMIMEKQENAPYEKLINALITVRSINRTDAMTLLATFGSLENIIRATPEKLALCPGLGPQKAYRLHKVLHMPFLRETRAKETVKPSTSKQSFVKDTEKPSTSKQSFFKDTEKPSTSKQSFFRDAEDIVKPSTSKQ